MSVLVLLDEKLSLQAGSTDELEIRADSVREALFKAARAFPKLYLVNCEGELRRFIRLRRNGRAATVDDALRDGDTLLLHVN